MDDEERSPFLRTMWDGTDNDSQWEHDFGSTLLDAMSWWATASCQPNSTTRAVRLSAEPAASQGCDLRSFMWTVRRHTRRWRQAPPEQQHKLTFGKGSTNNSLGGLMRLAPVLGSDAARLVIAHDVPNPVAGDHDEEVVGRDIDYPHLWKA